MDDKSITTIWVTGIVAATLLILGFTIAGISATISADKMKQVVYSTCIEQGKQLIDENCTR